MTTFKSLPKNNANYIESLKSLNNITVYFPQVLPYHERRI